MESINESFSRFISAILLEDIDNVQWGVRCCVGAAISYFIGKSFWMDAKKLMSVVRINQIKDLSLLLDPASIVVPLIVSVSGKVGSNRPIKLKSSNLQPVILQETKKSCILKRQVQTQVDSRGNRNEVCSWKEEHVDTHTVNIEVPWYLDDGTGQVFVLQAQRASNFLESTVAHVAGYESKILPVRGTADDSQRELDYLVMNKVTKKPVLVTGTPLTVIGEAVKDDSGRIQIQKPKKGPFHVSGKNIDELIKDCKGGAWLCKCTSLLLASYGIFLIGKQAFHYITRRYSNQEPQNRVLDYATDTSGLDGEDAATDTSGLDGEDAATDTLGLDGEIAATAGEIAATAGDGLSVTELTPNLCAICVQQEYNSVLVPCGHMCCCLNCSSRLVVCPLCRRRIDQVVEVFRS
ncbi:RING-type E3 ubiquitin transferase [Heracleum sosnowskyi]|uniref:RING-type E3 ubiquitin transferase n=1 Tax=Heracleum sosnowskyi TaxID=360622 RepID=A0AAD8J7Z4_9APIA|nr:RING-type E3 ubiquitin transferase [Heracleum sosnowskyi]